MSSSSESNYSILPQIRKRKNYFSLSKSQKNKNKILIRNEAFGSISQICKSMGLKISEIKLSSETNLEEEELKISVSESNNTKSYKAYIWLIAKDMINMSRKKYKILRKLLKINDFDQLPSSKSVFKIQHKLNAFFRLEKNNYGYFVIPAEKIKFICTQFLKSNKEFKDKNSRTFRIKLSADTVILSKKSRRLLNFTFSLLDNEKTAMSVHGTYVLGIFTSFSLSVP